MKTIQTKRKTQRPNIPVLECTTATTVSGHAVLGFGDATDCIASPFEGIFLLKICIASLSSLTQTHTVYLDCIYGSTRQMRQTGSDVKVSDLSAGCAYICSYDIDTEKVNVLGVKQSSQSSGTVYGTNSLSADVTISSSAYMALDDLAFTPSYDGDYHIDANVQLAPPALSSRNIGVTAAIARYTGSGAKVSIDEVYASGEVTIGTDKRCIHLSCMARLSTSYKVGVIVYATTANAITVSELSPTQLSDNATMLCWHKL